jgi:hypothetical protein
MGRNGGHPRGVSMAAYGEVSMATVTEFVTRFGTCLAGIRTRPAGRRQRFAVDVY